MRPTEARRANALQIVFAAYAAADVETACDALRGALELHGLDYDSCVRDRVSGVAFRATVHESRVRLSRWYFDRGRAEGIGRQDSFDLRAAVSLAWFLCELPEAWSHEVNESVLSVKAGKRAPMMAEAA